MSDDKRKGITLTDLIGITVLIVIGIAILANLT